MWEQTFDNTRRHCWQGILGRFLDGASLLDDDANTICTEDHSDNPKVVGTVEWMRFIHTIRDLGVNVSDVRLDKLAHVGIEIYPDFRVYLNPLSKTAYIKTTNDAVDEIFKAAYQQVQESYA